MAFESHALLSLLSSLTTCPIAKKIDLHELNGVSKWKNHDLQTLPLLLYGLLPFLAPLEMNEIVETAVDSFSHVERLHLKEDQYWSWWHRTEEYEPIAMNNNLRGRTMFTTRSVYANISTIISSSVSGAGFQCHERKYIMESIRLPTHLALGVRTGVHL